MPTLDKWKYKQPADTNSIQWLVWLLVAECGLPSGELARLLGVPSRRFAAILDTKTPSRALFNGWREVLARKSFCKISKIRDMVLPECEGRTFGEQFVRLVNELPIDTKGARRVSMNGWITIQAIRKTWCRDVHGKIIDLSIQEEDGNIQRALRHARTEIAKWEAILEGSLSIGDSYYQRAIHFLAENLGPHHPEYPTLVTLAAGPPMR